MRLYLSSYQLGDHPERFRDLVLQPSGCVAGGAGPRGLVIMNALDGQDEDRRRRDTAVQIAALGELGLQASDLDLRTTGHDELVGRLDEAAFVWVRGGNVFTLRMAMARSGFDELIVPRLADDRLVYAGFSAGPCVLAPSLRGLELCDPTEECAQTYGEVRFDGLGVLDRAFVPHLDSPGHPETEALALVAAQYSRDGVPFWALRDGQALVVDGAAPELIG